MKVTKKSVLAFHMEDDRADAVKRVCEASGLEMVRVMPASENAPLGLLAQADGWMSKSLMSSQPDYVAITDEMIVICGLDSKEMDRFLAGLRTIGTVRLKAVLTPQNAVWNGLQLFGELEGEFKAFYRK